MLPAITIAGAAALAYANQRPQYQGMAPDAEELFTGRLSNRVGGHEQIHTEETKIVRHNRGYGQKPTVSARHADNYLVQKNQVLGHLLSGVGIQDNRGILNADTSKSRSLPQLPNAECKMARDLRSVPSVSFDRYSAERPPENMPWLFRDEFGNAGGMPEQGASYVWPNSLYYGNPWGVGGQLFSSKRTGIRKDDGYLWPRKNNTGKTGKRVRFGGSAV